MRSNAARTILLLNSLMPPSMRGHQMICSPEMTTISKKAGCPKLASTPNRNEMPVAACCERQNQGLPSRTGRYHRKLSIRCPASPIFRHQYRVEKLSEWLAQPFVEGKKGQRQSITA